MIRGTAWVAQFDGVCGEGGSGTMRNKNSKGSCISAKHDTRQQNRGSADSIAPTPSHPHEPVFLASQSPVTAVRLFLSLPERLKNEIYALQHMFSLQGQRHVCRRGQRNYWHTKLRRPCTVSPQIADSLHRHARWPSCTKVNTNGTSL